MKTVILDRRWACLFGGRKRGRGASRTGLGGLADGLGARLAAAKTGFGPEMSVTSVGRGLGFVFAVRNPYGRTLRCCRSRGGLRSGRSPASGRPEGLEVQAVVYPLPFYLFFLFLKQKNHLGGGEPRKCRGLPRFALMGRVALTLCTQRSGVCCAFCISVLFAAVDFVFILGTDSALTI